MMRTSVAAARSQSVWHLATRARGSHGVRCAGLASVATGDSAHGISGAGRFREVADPKAFSPVTTMSVRGLVG